MHSRVKLELDGVWRSEKKRQPQDPGSKGEPGAPSALVRFVNRKKISSGRHRLLSGPPAWIGDTGFMSRTTIEIDERLMRRARKLTGLKTRREIVAKALEVLVRSETRKGVLAYFGRGVWKGNLKSARRNRV